MSAQDTQTPAVVVRDVSLRDGLQNIARVLPTETKLEWLQGLYDAGFRELEVGSFVPPKLVPQLADTAQIVAAARKLPGLHVSVLIPNLKGATLALEQGVDLMLLPLSASHAHSLANLRKAPDDVVQEVGRIRAEMDAAGTKTALEVGISTAFGCTIQGKVEPQEVLRLVKAVLDAGADQVSLADTVGYADPRQIRSMFEQVREVAGERLVCGHFHDTRGLGLANVMAALDTGIHRFDACVAGIGGCPHAPGASGNVNAEDLVYLMHSMGLSTGIDFDRLLALRARITQWLKGECFQGAIWKAGLPKTMLAEPATAGAAAA